MRARVTVVTWLLVAATATPGQAQICRGGAPGVNKPGFRPNAVVPYAVSASPDGRPFPAVALPCVWRAFQAWTAVNVETALGVRFVPGPGGITVRFDDLNGRLPSHVAGGWTDGTRTADGALVGATIWVSADTRVIDSCDAITKIVLHELGHLHGLADHRGPAGSTVMNSLDRKNDRGRRLPLEPTRCDAWQAARASAALATPAAVLANATLTHRAFDPFAPSTRR